MHQRSTWWATRCACLAIVLICLGQYVVVTQAAAVMSVDLGSEWMKVGVVSPGVPMEIALNRESKRKTPTILAFRDGVRTFGEDAVTVGIRQPAAAYGYLLDLLGKTLDNPIVELYRERFPYYEIIGDPERNTVVFKKSDTEQYSVEELIAQMLVKAKEFAQESTQQPIAECVLTVPGYFGQAEREALLTAAQLANLKVLQLINDYAAVALNYGVFHRGEINETAQYFIFYDMGASKTSASLVSYQLVKDKVTKETNPVVQVLGVGFDRQLGGLEMQLRLRDYLAEEFNAQGKTKTDVTKNPRALAKLFKEAGRVKNVLSANNEHYAQIENLIEDHDFKLLVTREKFEELCANLFERAAKPIEQALASSNLSLDVVTQVILFGGGTRVPRVQDAIKQVIKQELGKSLNADEAATMGAVYKAADLSTGFKVKKFIIKDAVVFPIQVSFNRDPGDNTPVKQVKRVLFASMNPYPQKKVITFNKHNDDFKFYVHYGDLEQFSAQDIAALGSLNITVVELQNIKKLLEDTQNEVVEAKGIKAYFYLDDSGIFRCTGVEYVYDKQVTETDGTDDDSTLAKLGSTISKLFTKDGDKTATEQDEQSKTEDDEKTDKKSNDEKPTSGGTQAQAEENKNDTEKKESNETIKLVTVKKPVPHKTELQFSLPLSGAAYEQSAEKLQAINNAEEQRTRLESAFNALESHVIEVQQKLGDDTYGSCATDAEKEQLIEECNKLAEWLYEDLEDPKPEIYEKKLSELRKLSNVFLARHWEHEERPEALKALKNMIDAADKFIVTAKNLTKETNPEKDVYTQVEIDTLSKIIDETKSWVDTESTAQKKLKRNDEVRLTVKLITEKMSVLDREVKYLVNKISIWKPKPKPTTKKTKKKKESSPIIDENTNDTETGSGEQVEDELPSTDEQQPTGEEPPTGDSSADSADEPKLTTDSSEEPETAELDAETVEPTSTSDTTTPHSEL